MAKRSVFSSRFLQENNNNDGIDVCTGGYCSIIILFQTEIQQMFKYLLSKDYRTVYNELSGLGLFSEVFSLSYFTYHDYFKRHNSNIEIHLQILANEKVTPIRAIKALVFLHSWLQTTPAIDDPDPVMNLISKFLKTVQQRTIKLKGGRSMSVNKNRGSAVVNASMVQQTSSIEPMKQVFLLHDIAQPYMLYLQKMVSIFDFYNSLKRNYIRPPSTPEVCILLNLFKCLTNITNHIPAMCRFIRKSYRPIAEAIAEVFSQDINVFYPKIYKYCYCEANRIQSGFYQIENELGEALAYKKGVEGTEIMANIMEDVRQLNFQLRAIYDEPALSDNRNVVQPKLIEVSGSEFSFVFHLEKAKNEAEVLSKTPKFYITFSKNTHVTETGDEKPEQLSLPPVFRNLGNEQEALTFRDSSPCPVKFIKKNSSKFQVCGKENSD